MGSGVSSLPPSALASGSCCDKEPGGLRTEACSRSSVAGSLKSRIRRPCPSRVSRGEPCLISSSFWGQPVLLGLGHVILTSASVVLWLSSR